MGQLTLLNSIAVKKYKADIGISFDGDADRIIMCDEKGSIIMEINNCNVSKEVEVKKNFKGRCYRNFNVKLWLEKF